MRPPLSRKFVEKAEAALVAAVEIFNKPSFRYREETFAILAINAWELLLKAKLLKHGANDPKVIRVYEPRKTKKGKVSKKLYLKRNRAGAPLTLSMLACIQSLDKDPACRVDPEVKANLDALIAVRDGAAHYITASPVLAKMVLEIASATVRNFVIATKEWFGNDLSEALSLVLPLAFISAGKAIDSVVVTAGESRVLKYLQGLASAGVASHSPYAMAVRLELKLERSKLSSASRVQITKDPDAVKVVLTEENIRERYPWDYRTLVTKCAARYRDFKQDGAFHACRKSLMRDPRYAHSRYLDPGNPKSGKKDFYSPSIFDVLDKEYALR